MRIDNTTGITGAQGPERVSGGGAAKPTTKPAIESAAVDHAEVSPLAQQASGTAAQRLEALRTAVESAQYRVSADELARSLVDAHLKP